MSHPPDDARSDADGSGEWQRTCEECGTELVQVQLDFMEADFSAGKGGTPVVRDVCPNPDCSRHQREYAEFPAGS